MSHPPVLIENWLPIEAIGAESKRERGASSALPPIYFLHVWWARRPLTTSRAAILGSVLPQWSLNWPPHLLKRFPSEETYHNWFIHLTGIRGDPVQGRKLVEWAKVKGIKLEFHPYGGAPRAFTVNPDMDDLETMGDLFKYNWGNYDLTMLDPFAGGGSIPFEALRYGFTTIANDLNPVATVILKATLDYPARFGLSLAEDIHNWGKKWADRVEEKLDPYFPRQSSESIFAYLWARTVACPTTGKPVPLSPNWWLRRTSPPTTVRLIAEPGMDRPRFEIVTGHAVRTANPDIGTISRGVARSPWTGETIEGEYIKAEAQAGRMEQMLYAIAIKRTTGLEFRTPTERDQAAIRDSETTLSEYISRWEIQGLVPFEYIPEGLKTDEPRRYGMYHWTDIFSPRQLFSLITFVEQLRECGAEMRQVMNSERASAVETYLALALNKCPNYSSRMSIWHPLRATMANTFNRHDFAFAWSHGEFDAAHNLLPWAINQIVDAYEGLAELNASPQFSFQNTSNTPSFQRLNIQKRNASHLTHISSDSVHLICIDPPYYDNVMYAELSDFFYIWLKRSVGHLFPEFFTD